AVPPRPITSYLPFQPDSGSQYSEMTLETAVGLIDTRTRQTGTGMFPLKCPSSAPLTVENVPVMTFAPAGRVSASRTVVFASARPLRLAQSTAAFAAPPAVPNAAAIASPTTLRVRH